MPNAWLGGGDSRLLQPFVELSRKRQFVGKTTE